jgi:hypothetical protein
MRFPYLDYYWEFLISAMLHVKLFTIIFSTKSMPIFFVTASTKTPKHASNCTLYNTDSVTYKNRLRQTSIMIPAEIHLLYSLWKLSQSFLLNGALKWGDIIELNQTITWKNLHHFTIIVHPQIQLQPGLNKDNTNHVVYASQHLTPQWSQRANHSYRDLPDLCPCPWQRGSV